jgi:hypothetical protein
VEEAGVTGVVQCVPEGTGDFQGKETTASESGIKCPAHVSRTRKRKQNGFNIMTQNVHSNLTDVIGNCRTISFMTCW